MKDSKDLVAVMNLYDNKGLYFPRDQCDRHCSHRTVRKHPCPKELLVNWIPALGRESR